MKELSIIEYAQLTNIDMHNPLSLLNYEPGKINWEKALK